VWVETSGSDGERDDDREVLDGTRSSSGSCQLPAVVTVVPMNSAAARSAISVVPSAVASQTTDASSTFERLVVRGDQVVESELFTALDDAGEAASGA